MKAQWANASPAEVAWGYERSRAIASAVAVVVLFVGPAVIAHLWGLPK